MKGRISSLKKLIDCRNEVGFCEASCVRRLDSCNILLVKIAKYFAYNGSFGLKTTVIGRVDCLELHTDAGFYTDSHKLVIFAAFGSKRTQHCAPDVQQHSTKSINMRLFFSNIFVIATFRSLFRPFFR